MLSVCLLWLAMANAAEQKPTPFAQWVADQGGSVQRDAQAISIPSTSPPPGSPTPTSPASEHSATCAA